MSKIVLGLIAGLVFGALDVALMLPMSFPDKTTALLGAFTSRFAIGFVIGCVQLPSWPGWLVGLLFGLLISLPDAIITHKYVPYPLARRDWWPCHRRANSWLESPHLIRRCSEPRQNRVAGRFYQSHIFFEV
jgi:hypothetical protein